MKHIQISGTSTLEDLKKYTISDSMPDDVQFPSKLLANLDLNPCLFLVLLPPADLFLFFV